DPLENAILDLEAETGCIYFVSVQFLALCALCLRSEALDELLVAQRLVEGDELNASGSQELLVGCHKLGAIFRDRFATQPHRLGRGGEGFPCTGRAVENE